MWKPPPFPAPSRQRKPDISQRRTQHSRNRTSRSAWSAWSLLPLWGAVGGPKAPASWPHLYASRGSPAERHSRSELLLKGPWLFALPLAPGFLLQPLGFLLR